MKYIGIDYGTKKVGIAISDDEASFAFPKDIIPNNTAIEYLKNVIQTENIEGIVIGESLASNGQDNDLAETVALFGNTIKEKVGKPVFFIREDFSSVEAHRYQTKKGDRDDSAAAIILQRFLDKRKK
jgi:putative Holliday junction resolvase